MARRGVETSQRTPIVIGGNGGACLLLIEFPAIEQQMK
jgi:hypothetical protein